MHTVANATKLRAATKFVLRVREHVKSAIDKFKSVLFEDWLENCFDF